MVGQHTPRKSTSGQIFAILGVLVLVGSMAPVPWLVEEGVAQTNPSLKVTRSDYRTGVEEIRGVGAIAYLVLEDDQRDPIYDTRGFVEMVASTEDGGETEFILFETGIGTGVYKGAFGFTRDPSQEDNAVYPEPFDAFGVESMGVAKTATLLVEESGVTVTVKTKESPTPSAEFTWHDTKDAQHFKVFFEGDPILECVAIEDSCPPSTAIRGSVQLDIEVNDEGLNREKDEQESHPNLVRVFSTSNPTGVRVSIQETAVGGSSNQNSSIFQGKMDLTTTPNPPSGQLFVKEGDRLFFEYFEPHREDGGFMIHVKPAEEGVRFQQEDQASISVDRSVYYGTTHPNNKHGADRAVVVIEDNNLDNRETSLEETVPFTITNKPGTFEARQLGPHSNTYVATIEFGTGSPDSISVTDAETVVVEYGGDTASFVWRDRESALVDVWQADPPGGSPFEGPFIGLVDDFAICVSDKDSRGLTSISVKVKTTSDPTDGLTVPLTKQRVVCPSTYHFEGSFSFDDEETGGESVLVDDQDWVVVEYNDPFTQDGSQQTVRSDYLRWFEEEPASLPPSPPAWVPADVESIEFSHSRTAWNSSVGLTLTLEDGADTPDSLEVDLTTQKCGVQSAVLELVDAVSREYHADLVFVPVTTDCTGFDPNAIPVSGPDDLGLIAGGAGPGYGLRDYVVIDTGDLFETMEVYPVYDAEFSVTRGAFGSGLFGLRLDDGDGLAHREDFSDDAGSDEYDLGEAFIHDGELVFVERTDSEDYEFDDAINTFALDSGDAAEPIADNNGDGVVDCDDVALAWSGDWDNNPACNSVNPGTGDISLGGVATCDDNTVPILSECALEVEYRYRAEYEMDASNEFKYNRTVDKVIFGGETAQVNGEQVIIAYTKAERTITLASPSTPENSDTLTYDPDVEAFTGDVEVWFTPGANPIEAMISYKDEAQAFDGNPGNADPDHFRSISVRSLWRPSETATIRVMKDDFSGSATGTLYGPGIPVEVLDLDGGHTDRRSTIKVRADLGEDTCTTATLRETGTDTGIFHGVIDLRNPDPGCDLRTNGAKDTLTLNYTDGQNVDGETEHIATNVDRRASQSGNPMVCRDEECEDATKVLSGGEFNGTQDSFYIRVSDRDRTPEQSIQVRIASTSQPIGELITLTRVGSGISAYFLSEELRFETTNNPGNGRLFVEHDDHWWVEYDDPLSESGEKKRRLAPDEAMIEDRLMWKNVVDGSVRFDRLFHIGKDPGLATDAGHGLQRLARGVVVITDRDLITEAGEINQITVEKNGDIVEFPEGSLEFNGDLSDDLVLVETGVNTGEFVGVFSFGEEGNCATGFSCAQPSDLEVTYKDPNPTSSFDEDEFPRATAKWHAAGRGVVAFDRAGYTVDMKPRLTVYDSDLGSDPAIEVTVVSQTDASGIKAVLDLREDVEDDENPDGIYSGTISLSTSTSGGENLQVDPEEDEIEARFDDVEPNPVTRKATAVIGVAGEPVTQLVTDPVDPQGENGWFTSAVEISFTVNQPVETTLFTINGGPERVWNDNPVVLDEEGVHEIEFWSIDLFEGIPEEVKTATIKVVLSNPTTVVDIQEATSLPGGLVELTWESSQGLSSFEQYRVYRGSEGDEFNPDSLDLVSENLTTESFTDDPPAGTSPPQQGEMLSYHVLVAHESGLLSDAVDSIDALSDRVAPRVSSFSVDTTELREDLGEDTVNADLTVEDDEENLKDIDRVFLRVVDPFGNEEAEVNMTGSSSSFSAAYTEFDTCGVYGLFGIASDAIGNEGRLNESVRFIGIDVDAPQLSGVPTQIEQGQSLNVTVVDNCAGVASVAYSINGGDRREVNVPARQIGDNCTPGPCEVAFQIAASRLVPGENRITFELSDANETANFATIRHTVTMIVPDDDDDTLDAPSLSDSFSNLVEYGGGFSFTVSGGTPTTIAFEAGDLDLDNVIGGLNPATGRVRVDVGDLDSGPHTATVTVTNAFGTDTADFSFYILEEGVPLPPVNVQVSKNDKGQPVISWSPNPDSEVEVGGYLVHRASSPWKVIAVTDADTETYTDTTAKEGKTYQYAVTSYGANGEGRLNEGDDSEESLAWFQGVGATTFETDEIDGGIPPVVFWVILIVLAVIVVVSLLYVNRRQIFGSKAEEVYAEEYPDEAETPFGEERHMIRCPNCSEDFHVSGERPVVTDCPNCGRKGILR